MNSGALLNNRFYVQIFIGRDWSCLTQAMENQSALSQQVFLDQFSVYVKIAGVS